MLLESNPHPLNSLLRISQPRPFLVFDATKIPLPSTDLHDGDFVGLVADDVFVDGSLVSQLEVVDQIYRLPERNSFAEN